MFYVYVLKSNKGKLYIGHTNNIERRLIEHNSGLSPYTKGRGPWELVYKETFNSRGEAMKREKFLKSGKGRGFLKSR
jgi:putative endonuclease